jgi:hypothetical protein
LEVRGLKQKILILLKTKEGEIRECNKMKSNPEYPDHASETSFPGGPNTGLKKTFS